MNVKLRYMVLARPHLIPALIAGILLCIGIFPLPYGYYQMLRWIVCIIAVFITYISFNLSKVWAAAVFVVIAILFNPIFTIHFEKEAWQWIDAACGALFIASVFILRIKGDIK